jgi:carbon starvation protein
MFVAFAMLFGLIQKKFHFSGWKEAVVGLACTAAAFAVGMNLPLIAGKQTWMYITFGYIFLAAVLPMWFLMQPRDYMTTFMFIGMIAGAAIGLLVAHPAMNLPVFTGFHNDKLGDLFPILFVTVACGAVSGFHSLVSSGTSSKTIANEKDMLKVGYGAMVLESLLAVLALCVAGAAAAADGTAAAGTPFQVFSAGRGGLF